VKENRQGFLSRSIKQFFKLFRSLKNVMSLSKDFFDKLNCRCRAQRQFSYPLNVFHFPAIKKQISAPAPAMAAQRMLVPCQPSFSDSRAIP